MRTGSSVKLILNPMPIRDNSVKYSITINLPENEVLCS